MTEHTASKELRDVLGLNVRLFRTRRRLSQAELARAVGTSAARISMIERSETSSTIDLIARISLALQVEPSELLLPDRR